MSARLWELAGYRAVINPFPAGAPVEGVIQSQIFLRLRFMDRLRLLLFGRMQISLSVYTDFEVPPGARMVSQSGHMILHPHCTWPGKDQHR
jgi:hypothetical protein